MIAGLTRLARRLVAPAPAAPVVRDEPPAPFMPPSAPSPRELARRAERLAALGVRLVPFGRDAAMAFVSDTDGSRRDDYLAYRRQLVDEGGLDVGDSWFHAFRSRRGRGVETALVLFRYDADRDDRDGERDLDATLTFAETIREVAHGNLSHPHCVSTCGPQLGLLLPDPDDATRFPVRASNAAVQMMPVLAVRVTGPHRAVGPRDVTVAVRDGAPGVRLRRDPSRDRAASDEAPATAWLHVERAPGATRHPTVDELDAVHVAGGADAVTLVGLWTEPCRAMIAAATDRWGLRSRLWVDHNARGLIGAGCESYRDGLLRDEVAAERDGDARPVALYARRRDGREGFSMLLDDPEGDAYVLPDLVARGLRLVNPSGLSGEVRGGFHPLEAVPPTTARDGTPLRIARRCMPPLTDPGAERHPLEDDAGTRTAALRLGRALDALETADGPTTWPLYTHLGNLRPKSDRTDPYLDRTLVRRLEDAVHGGAGAPRRVWLAAASSLYDHAHVLATIADRLERGPDGIDVRTAPDPHDGRPMPEDETHLNGLTLEAPDPWAPVRLDGAPIELVHRAVGPPSLLTVVGRGRARSLLRPEAVAGPASWVPRDPGDRPDWEPARALRVALPADGRATLRVDARGATLPAAAHLAWRQRTEAGADVRVALVLETLEGATFGFGDLDALPDAAAADCLATEALPTPPTTGAPATRVACFHAMDWSPVPPLPAMRRLPAHPLRAVHLHVRGPAGATLVLETLELVRPGSTHDRDRRTVILGGRVHGPDAARAVVRLRTDDDRAPALDAEVRPDATGSWLLEDVPRGATVIVEGTAADGAALAPVRGPRHEALETDLDLDLVPAARPEAAS